MGKTRKKATGMRMRGDVRRQQQKRRGNIHTYTQQEVRRGLDRKVREERVARMSPTAADRGVTPRTLRPAFLTGYHEFTSEHARFLSLPHMEIISIHPQRAPISIKYGSQER